MYNEDIKKRYIQEKESTTSTPDGYLTRLFKKSEVFETQLDKDVSCFTVYEILDFYKTINISTMESLVVLNNHLFLYTQWCLQHNLVPDCQNHYAEINNDAIKKCINIISFDKSIVTRETLYTWIGQIDNPSDAFIMLCLFEGIKGNDFCEIAQLKMSDFSGNKVKLCTGREITVSDKLLELAELTDNTMEYYPVNSNRGRVFQLEDEGYILKKYHNSQGKPTSYQRGRRIYQKLLRNFVHLNVSEFMKPNSLAESGKIDYINRRAQEEGMSGKEFLYSDFADEIYNKYEYDMKRLKLSFLRKYEEYLI